MTTFAIANVLFSFAVKDRLRSVFSLETFADRRLLMTTGMSAAAILLGTELGILQRILDTVSLTGEQWVDLPARRVDRSSSSRGPQVRAPATGTAGAARRPAPHRPQYGRPCRTDGATRAETRRGRVAARRSTTSRPSFGGSRRLGDGASTASPIARARRSTRSTRISTPRTGRLDRAAHARVRRRRVARRGDAEVADAGRRPPRTGCGSRLGARGAARRRRRRRARAATGRSARACARSSAGGGSCRCSRCGREARVPADGRRAAVGELVLDETSIREPGGSVLGRLHRVEVEAPRGAYARRAARREPAAARAASNRPAQQVRGTASSRWASSGPRRESFGPTAIEPRGHDRRGRPRDLPPPLRDDAREGAGHRVGDDVEELHDMRVATRRMRAALALFADALPAAADELRRSSRGSGRRSASSATSTSSSSSSTAGSRRSRGGPRNARAPPRAARRGPRRGAAGDARGARLAPATSASCAASGRMLADAQRDARRRRSPSLPTSSSAGTEPSQGRPPHRAGRRAARLPPPPHRGQALPLRARVPRRRLSRRDEDASSAARWRCRTCSAPTRTATSRSRACAASPPSGAPSSARRPSSRWARSPSATGGRWRTAAARGCPLSTPGSEGKRWKELRKRASRPGRPSA